MRALTSVIALVLAACSSAPRPPAARAFDPGPWLEDLSQLEDHLGRHYANLEWNLQHRGLNPAELDRTARAALSAARTDRDALAALVRFISAFRDPHLDWSTPAATTRYDLRLTSDGTVVLVKTAGAGACGLRPGDVVETIEDRPALEQLTARLPLVGFQNPGLRMELALRTLTFSPFAPPSALRLTIAGEKGPRLCVIAPVSSPGGPAPDGAPAPVAELTPATPAAVACEALGSSIKPGAFNPFLFRPERHAAFAPLPASDAELGAGILRLASGRTLGWIRIPSFVEEEYPRACAAAWDGFRGQMAARCGEECQSDFRNRAWAPRLVEAVAARLEALGAAQVSGVVVDVTDNGGGNGWASDIARLLSAEALTCPALGEVREAAAAERARGDLEGLEACEGPGLDGQVREALKARRAWAEARREEASSPCDLSGLFREGPAAARCSMLTRGRRAPCDPLPPAPSPLPRGCAALDGASELPRRRGLVRVPLYILINRRTASAAEQVAAVLRDNHAATLVGERSLGAGCGYIDGGGEVRLRHSGLKVRTPNCVRFRLDGTNEIEGIEPDVAVPWAAGDLREFDSYAEKVLANADALFDRPALRTSAQQR